MKANEMNINKTIRNKSIYLIMYVQNKYGVDRNKAISILMKTVTYATLTDKSTKLFCESNEYIENMLEDEIRGDIKEWSKL